MEKKYTLAIITLGIIGLMAIGLVAADSFEKGLKLFKPSEDDRQAMRTAIENEDYVAWKTLMEDRIESMKSQITEERFNEIVEFHNTMNFTNMQGQGMHQGKGKKMNGQGKNLGNCPYSQE